MDEYLASLGWALPIQFYYLQIIEFAKPEYTADQVNEAFVTFFIDDNHSKLKELVVDTIMSTDEIEPWKEMIDECIYAFKKERYLIVVPALITVLEGYLSKKVGTFNTTNVRIIDPTKSKSEEPMEHRLNKTIWLTVSKIIDDLYQKSDFTGPQPDTLNRHWVLHGRSTPREAKIDSLRIFNLLGALCVA